jgi:hypothetical protein
VRFIIAAGATSITAAAALVAEGVLLVFVLALMLALVVL